MKRSKHQYHHIISTLSFIEFLVALSLFIAVCGIQLTNELAAFDTVHFVVAVLVSIPLYLFRRWTHKRQPEPSTRATALLLTLAISLLALIEAHTPLKIINTLCFALLMFAVVTPPNKQGE